MNIKRMQLILLFTLLANVALFAQHSTEEDPVGNAFFSPELVMQNQQAVNLTESQRTNIQKELQSAQGEFIAMQWDLQKETEKFKLLIAKEKTVETEVSEQLYHILIIENKIKKRKIVLLTRVKNILSHEQQEKLVHLKQVKN